MIRRDGSLPTGPAYRAITRANIGRLPEWTRLDRQLREATEVVSTVLPFRTDEYIIQELIDWDRVPDDPMFQLTFPQRGMLEPDDYDTMAALLRSGAAPEVIKREADRIRMGLNPHPAGQMTHNGAMLDGMAIPGIQHKYRETVLFFPSQGQTCHAYCTFCFRWAQFVGIEELKFSNKDIEQLAAYLRAHREVTDVLFTGGDPMIMRTRALESYFERLMEPEFDHVLTFRVGTKAPAYWPQRFVTDPDADDLLRLFERVVASGRQLALMGHYSHPTELSTDIAREALSRILSTGAVVRMQSPIVRHINDDAETWAELWRTGSRLGAVPYYMFVERDTGARNYFEVPLARAWDVFRGAYQQVSGVARTARGPSMSAMPGKVHILGVNDVGGERAFVLEYLQARRPELVRRPFFARFDPDAVWFDDLEPLSAADLEFFSMNQGQSSELVPLTLDNHAIP